MKEPCGVGLVAWWFLPARVRLPTHRQDVTDQLGSPARSRYWVLQFSSGFHCLARGVAPAVASHAMGSTET